MLERISTVKQKLDAAITQLCEVSWMFAKQLEKDFTRERKLSFRKVVSLILPMEGGTLTTELLKYFGCSADIAVAPEKRAAAVDKTGKRETATFIVYAA